MADVGNTLYGMNFNGAWSMGTSKRSEWPGKYDPNFYDKPKSPKWSQNKSKREGLASKNPAPPVGTYQVTEEILPLSEKKKLKKHLPGYSMGQKLPDEIRRSSVGPNTYNPHLISSVPTISFGYKEETNWARDGPAPNLYQNNVDEEKMKSTMSSWKKRKTGFGTASRGFIPKALELGPGQYNPPINQVHPVPKISFARSSRDLMSRSSAPGPGQYSPKLAHTKSSGFSIGNKYVPIKSSDVDTPGPGAYQPRKPKSMQNIRIGREGKFQIVDKEQMQKPGPGDYDQQMPADKVSHLDLEMFQSIGTSKRPPIANLNKVPGPGSYQPEEKLFEGPRFTMRPKLEKNKVTLTPGPGQYDPEEVTEKPNYHYTVPYTPQPGLGRADRSTPVYSKFKNVGPGSYNISGSLGSMGNKFSMGKSQRFKELDPEDVGPAQYRIPDTIGKIPRYLMEQNKESKFMSLQAEEQKLRSKI